MRFTSLGSGSSGNATLIESHDGVSVTRLLVDCGLPFKHLDERMAQRGLRVSDIDAVFITHEHSDHIGCARQLTLQLNIPILMSRGTYAAIGSPDLDGCWQVVTDGVKTTVKGLELSPFTVAHDAKEPLQLTISDGQHRLGILTDLGHVTPYVVQHLQGVDALLLEFNHDAGLLQQSRYPAFLKQRISGGYGHLSNAQASALLETIMHDKLKHVVAAHLSEQNNEPRIVQNSIAPLLGCKPDHVLVADALSGLDWLDA